MKFESGQAPVADGSDAAGSNLPGAAPPNGIPSTTVTANGQSTTGSAEILPDRIHNFTRGFSQFMHSSFQDTYTVGGVAAGPFDVTVRLHATGTMSTVPSGPFNAMLGGNVQARIGTFNPDPTLLSESTFRLAPFDAAANADSGAFNLTTAGSMPIDITAIHTKTGVNVGDVFNLGYQLRSAASLGQMDIFGGISFTLPDGVFLTSTMAQALPPPGSIRIVGNDGVNDGITVVDIPAGTTATGTVDISQNPLVGTIDLGNGLAAGDVNITDNAGVTVIDIGSGLTASDVTISDNDASTTISLGDGAATGNVAITENDAAEVISLGNNAEAAFVEVTGNRDAAVISIGDGAAVSDVTITDNGNATVSLGENTTVTGNVTLETTGSATLDLDGVTVGGDSDVTADGYTTVEANTAAGQTAVTMINSEATMEMVLPTGAFPAGAPVPFGVEKLTSGAVETVGDDTVTHLQSYRFNFDTPTLNQDATLNFEINLLAMDDPSRQLLLDLLDADALLTLAVRGDAPEAPLQLFNVCAPDTTPIADECVLVLWLDENRVVLDPLGAIDPSFIRFEGLVGHFSTYSVVAATPVPEPACLSILALGAWSLLRRRR